MTLVRTMPSRILALIALPLVFVVTATPRTSAHFSNPHTVCIDAGHGYDDPGAVWYGLREADQTLIIATKLQELLTTADSAIEYNSPVNVVMTRTGAGSPTESFGNTARANVCNGRNADTVVSIHLNSFPSNPSVDYAKPFYGKRNKDKAFADELGRNYKLTLPEGSNYGTGLLTVNASSQFASGLLLKTSGAATLFETLFISNEYEAAALRASIDDGSYARHEEIARQLFNGIRAWYKAR